MELNAADFDMDHRRLAEALNDLQVGLSKAAELHSNVVDSPRTGVLLALNHIDRFLSLVLPSTNRMPLEALSTALASLDAGVTEPLVEIQLERLRRGTTLSQNEVRALLAGTVTFLIDKRLAGPALLLTPACEAVARTANRHGFRCSDGARLNGSSIKAMRNELLADRVPAGPTMSFEQLLRMGIKDRGRLGHREYYHLCRSAQIQFETTSRSAIVERVLGQFRKLASTLRI